jgi:hypothetical protein
MLAQLMSCQSHCDPSTQSDSPLQVLNLQFPGSRCTAELLIQYAASDADNYMGYGQLRGTLSLDLLSGKATEVRPQSDYLRSTHSSRSQQRDASRRMQAWRVYKQGGRLSDVHLRGAV